MTVLDKITDRAKGCVEAAHGIARQFGSPSVEPEHLLAALAAEGHGLAAKVLEDLGMDRAAIERALVAHRPAPAPEGQAFHDVLLRAQSELTPLGHSYVGTEHLLLALTTETSPRFLQVMASLKLDLRKVRGEVYAILGHGL